MRYLFLIYTDEREVARMAAHERTAVEAECQRYERLLATRGALVAVEALHPAATATTVRIRGERVSVTDGPFAELREQLTGLYLIDARDLNDAIRLAAGIPPARLGSVEVRPVRARVPPAPAE